MLLHQSLDFCLSSTVLYIRVHSLFIHLLVETHLGCFKYLAIMNKTAINIYGLGKNKFESVSGTVVLWTFKNDRNTDVWPLLPNNWFRISVDGAQANGFIQDPQMVSLCN